MTLKLYDTDLKELLISKEFPTGYYNQEGGVSEGFTEISHHFGQATFREIFFDGIHISYGNASLRQQTVLNFVTDFESIEMHFTLRGYSSSLPDGFTKEVSFGAFEHNIIYSNGLKGQLFFQSPEFEVFEINFSPAIFQKYLPDSFQHFREEIIKGRSALMTKHNRSLSPEMYRVIQEIIQCKREGILRKLFLEAKVLELLLLQLEQLQTVRPVEDLNQDMLYAVRDFLESNLEETYSLGELSHRFGTNEYTLKKGFKQLFGNSVISYWQDQKMKYAWKMLQETGTPVNDISYAIGFANPRHFSTAFKRKFGVVPTSLKKK